MKILFILYLFSFYAAQNCSLIDIGIDISGHIGSNIIGVPGVTDVLHSLEDLISPVVNSMTADQKELLKNLIDNFSDAAFENIKNITKFMNFPEGTGANMTELVKIFGYPVEEHTVTTSDGYILTIFRIPYGRSETSKTAGKPVVLLIPGLVCTSAYYATQGPRSLANILADNGFDVWIGNPRGNKFSRAHISMDPDRDNAFWDFSWHEQGIYDIPATIDYILANTSLSTLTYIGHSEGTTDFFVMASTQTDYNDKINLAISLAPIAYMSNLSSPVVRALRLFETVLEFLADTNTVNEIPFSKFFAILGGYLCDDGSIFQPICLSAFGAVTGFDFTNLNATLFPVFLSHFPGGFAFKQVVHYIQEINSGDFRQYDFGITKNLLTYGSLTPPSYNLSAVSAAVALYYSGNDFLSSTEDVDHLQRELPNIVKTRFIDTPVTFNHLDYLWGKNVETILYSDIVDLIKKYSNIKKHKPVCYG